LEFRIARRKTGERSGKETQKNLKESMIPTSSAYLQIWVKEMTLDDRVER
jgi:hypothetical protein